MRPVKDDKPNDKPNEYLKSVLDSLDRPVVNETEESERLEMIQYIKDHLWTK